MKILIVGYFTAFWHERAWVRALTEQGHDVHCFEFGDYFLHNVVGRIQNRFLFGPVVDRINDEFTGTVRRLKPQVVLCYRALPLRWQAMAGLKRDSQVQSTVFVCYNNDNAFGSVGNKLYWRLFKRAVPYYDLHLVYREADAVALGDSVSSYVLRSHYLPWLHRPIDPEQATQKRSDICFLGHFEPDRRVGELDTLMKEVPANYSIHGSGWAKNSRSRSWASLDTTELQGEEYIAALNATKIALVFFSTWNSDTYTRRVFEIPACGTFMLSQRTDTMQSLYQEDKEAVYFNGADELVDKARYYLKNDAQRGRIAEAGRVRCIKSGYDIYSRMNEWLERVNKLQQREYLR